jgi:hypothetical protein
MQNGSSMWNIFKTDIRKDLAELFGLYFDVKGPRSVVVSMAIR